MKGDIYQPFTPGANDAKDGIECPACGRGELDRNLICKRCGVAVPNGAPLVTPTAGRRKMGRGPSNEQASAYTEYVRKKEEDRDV